eukprot:gene4073-biopygen11391
MLVECLWNACGMLVECLECLWNAWHSCGMLGMLGMLVRLLPSPSVHVRARSARDVVRNSPTSRNSSSKPARPQRIHADGTRFGGAAQRDRAARTAWPRHVTVRHAFCGSSPRRGSQPGRWGWGER